jgi:hypothetical protein
MAALRVLRRRRGGALVAWRMAGAVPGGCDTSEGADNRIRRSPKPRGGAFGRDRAATENWYESSLWCIRGAYARRAGLIERGPG